MWEDGNANFLGDFSVQKLFYVLLEGAQEFSNTKYTVYEDCKKI